MSDAELEKLIHGQWITSFDLRYPTDEGTFTPYAFLACFIFMKGGTFRLYQHRNKGDLVDYKVRHGTYSIDWDPEAQIPTGVIAIASNDRLGLRFYVRNSNELHWLMVYVPDPTSATDPTRKPEPEPHAPVAQGTLLRAEMWRTFEL